MVNPILQSFLALKKLRAQRNDGEGDREKRGLRRNESNESSSSNRSDSSRSDSSMSSTKSIDSYTISPLYRKKRRHAICEENVREYYTLWYSNDDKLKQRNHHSKH